MRGDRNLTDQILAAEGMVGLATRGALPWPREARGANIDRRALSRVIDGLRRENVSKTRTAWLAAVQALVVSARPDLAEQFEAYLGADPLVDEGSRGSNPLRGMTIGEIGVVYEALLALSNRRNRKARGQYFTPDDVAAFMAQQAAKFPEGTWLDPCCGVGNLSWHLAAAMDAPGDFVKHRLALVDIDLVALKTATALIVASFAPPEDRTVLPSLSERATAVDYLGNKPVPGHDFVLMNPPYAATAVRRSFRTGKTRDTFAYFLERASTAKGLVAITPASYLSAAKYAPVREVVDEREGGDVYVFDNVPDTVFRGFKYGSANTSQTNFVRAAILVSPPGAHGWRVTPILRWSARSRERLWAAAPLFLRDRHLGPGGQWAKIMPGTEEVWAYMESAPRKLRDLVTQEPTDFALEVGSTPRYYVSATKRSLDRRSKHVLNFNSEADRQVAYLLLNSSLPYWWWRCLDGGVTLNRATLLSLPVPESLKDLDPKACAAFTSELEGSETRDLRIKLNAGRPNENVRRPRELAQRLDSAILSHVDFDFELLFSPDLFAESD